MTSQVIDRYRVLDKLGQGGMASVYRAHDPRFERDVAIKVLPREFLHDPSFRERFSREAKIIAQLEHGAIVPVYDFGEHEGQPYLVMRYMPGGSLADRIQAEGSLPLADTQIIVSRIAAALDAAHSWNLIHRDVKPANILFDPFDDAYLSDFGIVKLSEATAQLTGSGIIGTPAYMAPEMAGKGGTTSLIDVYALGVTVYQMLTARLPFEADTPMGLLMAHLGTSVPNILAARPDLPEDIQEIIDRVLAKDPAERYPSPGAFAADLNSLFMEEAASPAPVYAPPPEPEPPPLDYDPDALTMRDAVDDVDYEETIPDPRHEMEVEPVPADTPAPAVTAPIPAQAKRSGLPGWVWIVGALVAVALVVGGLFAAGVLGGGGSAAEVAAPTEPDSPPTEVPVGAPLEAPTEAAVSGATGAEVVGFTMAFPFVSNLEDITVTSQLVHEVSLRTGFTIGSVGLDDNAAAVEALCAGNAQVAVLDAFSYLEAAERDCAVVALVVVKFGSPTYAGQFIARSNSPISSLSDLAGLTFCRPGPDSVSGWMVPSLTMQAAGMDPDTYLAQIIDAGDHNEVVRAVYNGECATGATFVDARPGVEEDYPDVMDVVNVIATTISIPNEVVSFHPDVPIEERLAIVDALQSLMQDPDRAALFENEMFSLWEDLESISSRDFDQLRQLIEAANAGGSNNAPVQPTTAAPTAAPVTQAPAATAPPADEYVCTDTCPAGFTMLVCNDALYQCSIDIGVSCPDGSHNPCISACEAQYPGQGIGGYCGPFTRICSCTLNAYR